MERAEKIKQEPSSEYEDGIAHDRPEDEPCQRGTYGCCIDHSEVIRGCETW